MSAKTREHRFLMLDRSLLALHGSLKTKQPNTIGLVLESDVLKQCLHFCVEGLYQRWENRGKLGREDKSGFGARQIRLVRYSFVCRRQDFTSASFCHSLVSLSYIYEHRPKRLPSITSAAVVTFCSSPKNQLENVGKYGK